MACAKSVAVVVPSPAVSDVLLATSFYVVQRTCRARIAGDLAPWFVVLGYNFFIVIAGTGYLLGITQGKEYAELFETMKFDTFLSSYEAVEYGLADQVIEKRQ